MELKFYLIYFQISVLTLLFSIITIATASEELPDQLGFSLGGFMVSSIEQRPVCPLPKGAPLGVLLDLNRDLDLDNRDESIRIDSYWRFTPRHRIDFSYFKFRVIGEKTLTETFSWDNQEYNVGARVSSYFENTTTKLGYIFFSP